MMNALKNSYFKTGLAVCLCCASFLTYAQDNEAVVELAIVTERDSSPVIRLPGTVIGTRDALISAELSGRLTWVAQVGEHIESGQPVAVIDDHLLRLQLRNSEAQVKRLLADINYNQRQQQRLERLAKQNNMAQSELDEIQARLEMLRQDLSMAEVERDRARYNLQRSEVTAPFAGIVVSRRAAAGEYTEPAEALLRLVNTEHLEVRVSAPLRIAHFTQDGDEIQVSSEQRSSTTFIRSIIPVGDERSRMMEVRLSITPGQWFIGEAVTAELPVGPAETTLSVPRDALVLRDDQVYVYTVDDDKQARKVTVTPGAGHGPYIAIDGDLAAGDAVVVRGAERLREGQALKVLDQHLVMN